MPASTPLGIRYPLSSEPPVVHTDMQRMATDVDGLLTNPYGASRVDANQGPTPTTGVVWLAAWVSSYVQGGVTANTSGLIVPVAGTYEVSAWARFTVGVASSIARLIIGNGASAVIADAMAAPAAAGVNISLYVSRVTTLAAGEQIRAGFNQATASSLTFIGGATVNGLTAKLIRKT